MKNQLIGLSVVALVLGGVVSANATAVTGKFTNDGWIQFANDDGVYDNGRVYPGWGGQAFDAEYLFYKMEGNSLSIGLQTGFNVNAGWQTYSDYNYYAGDLALSFDGDSSDYEYAFDFGFATRDISGNTVGGQDVSGLYEVDVDGWGGDISFSESAPFAMESGNIVTEGLTTGGSDSTLETYWRTVTFDVTELTRYDPTFTFSRLDAHWTMSCGNDVIEGSAPVPEPATMLLFGTGLMGLAGSRIRRMKK